MCVIMCCSVCALLLLLCCCSNCVNWLNVMVVVRFVVVLVNCIKLGLGKVMLWLVCVVSFGGVNRRCCMLASVCSICVVISCMVWCVGCDIGCFFVLVSFGVGVLWTDTFVSSGSCWCVVFVEVGEKSFVVDDQLAYVSG